MTSYPTRIAPWLALALLFCTQTALAQLSGTVRNQANGEALPFAQLKVINLSDSSLQGALSGLNGQFILTGLSEGYYQVKMAVLGYETYVLDSLKLGPEPVDLGTIELREAPQTLGEVEIAADRSYVRSKAGMKLIDVRQDLVSGGGSALDALNMVPSVEVNTQGQIKVRGEDDLFVLINGRETSLSYLPPGQALRLIPVSSIERIEIITSAGAQYNPEGDGGIINVVLKRKKEKGLSFLLDGSGSFNPISHYLGLSVERKVEKGSLSLSYGQGLNQSRSNALANRIWLAGNGARLGLNSYEQTENRFRYLNADLAYEPNDSTTLGLNAYVQQAADEGSVRQALGSTADFMGSSLNENELEGAYLGLGAFFEKGLKQEALMSLDLFAGSGQLESRQENQLQGISTAGELSGQQTETDFSNFSAESSYERPLGEDWELLLGLNAEWDIEQNQQERIPPIDDPFAQYEMWQLTNSLYGVATWISPLGELAIGSRIEHYNNYGKAGGQRVFEQELINFYPSLQLDRSWGNDSLRHGLSLALSRRISRPDFFQLNPQQRYADALSLELGNPDLQPEFTHIAELDYELRWPKTTLSSTLFHRLTTQVIQELGVPAGDGLILNTFRNENLRFHTGLELYAKTELSQRLTARADLLVAQKQFSEQPINSLSPRLNWQASSMLSYQAGRGLKLQLSWKGMGHQSGLYYLTDPYQTLSLGLRKDILSGKGFINLSVADLLDGHITRTLWTQEGLKQRQRNKPISRIFRLALNLRLNHSPREKIK